ncbi:MAG: tetratricopeptide repeat protein [Gemmatimonadota bacterium]|nr:tetratricopeptide repeat protein [Gemmatimonadota bacterium]
MHRLYLTGWIFLAAMIVIGLRGGTDGVVPSLRFTHPEVPEYVPRSAAATWYAGMKPFCNPVEVATRHRASPPPEGFEGAAFSAACFALAGDTDRAREIISALDGDHRWQAAGVVFNVAHPVADAGDDSAAGPVMELVVEFWPNHYMALYHAGMARLGLGDADGARDYLERFIEHYTIDDGWTRNAQRALAEMRAR